MSHFTVLVIGENAEEQLKPYDENTEVEPYDRTCYCAEHNLNMKVREELKKHFGGDFDKIFKTPYNALDDSKQPEWSEYIKPWFDKQKELEDSLVKKFKKPDPKCEECNGTGLEKSTRNPQSKWDWYSLGGRWTGYFKLKPKVKGIKGTPGLMTEQAKKGFADSCRKGDIDFEGMLETRTEEMQKNYKKMYKEYRSGKITKSHFSFSSIKFKDGDIEPMEDYLKREAGSVKDILCTYAFVKEGKWYEKGEMGWFGMSSNEKGDWDEEFMKMFDALPDDEIISVYDCHI
jgi:hypothetical protein